MTSLSSLNRVLMDRLMAWNSAWQRRIGLPMGALFRFRLGNLMRLSEKPFRSFVDLIVSSSRAPEIPFAGNSRVLARRRRPCLLWQACGQFEDGVPHAEALSPFKPRTSINAHNGSERYKEFALVVSALATTPQTSSM